MIKTLHLINGLHTGGAETFLANLLAHCDRSRFEPAVATLISGGPVRERVRALDVPVYDLGMSRGRPSPLALLRLCRLLIRERPAILQTWLYHADLLGALAGRLTGVPHIVWNIQTANGVLFAPQRLTRLTGRACAVLSGIPSAVISNSETGRDVHATFGYRPRRWAVLPSGFDVERYHPEPGARADVRQELGWPQDAFVVGLICRYDDQKDHATFFEAAGQLAPAFPQMRFLLAGRGVDGDNADVVQLADRAGVADGTCLLGERADVPRLMASLDVLASSSAYGEGFPNVVGEAMACAVPCVVTDVGDSAHAVGETGLVVPPRDGRALADAIGTVASWDPAARAVRGQAARSRVVDRFSIGAVTRMYEDLYLSLVAH